MFGTGGYGHGGFGGGGAPAPGLNAWTRGLGTTQGRIVPVNFDPVDGDWVFCLGRDLAALEQNVDIGDFVQVEQSGDFDTIEIVEVSVRMRGATALPVGHSWKFSLRIDGSERVSRTLRDGEEIDQKIAANVSQLSGVHALAFRLELRS
jgi:hypothetical protein